MLVFIDGIECTDRYLRIWPAAAIGLRYDFSGRRDPTYFLSTADDLDARKMAGQSARGFRIHLKGLAGHHSRIDESHIQTDQTQILRDRIRRGRFLQTDNDRQSCARPDAGLRKGSQSENDTFPMSCAISAAAGKHFEFETILFRDRSR